MDSNFNEAFALDSDTTKDLLDDAVFVILRVGFPAV